MCSKLTKLFCSSLLPSVFQVELLFTTAVVPLATVVVTSESTSACWRGSYCFEWLLSPPKCRCSLMVGSGPVVERYMARCLRSLQLAWRERESLKHTQQAHTHKKWTDTLIPPASFHYITDISTLFQQWRKHSVFPFMNNNHLTQRIYLCHVSIKGSCVVCGAHWSFHINLTCLWYY